MDYRDTKLYQDFKPLLIMMQLCGLYHTRAAKAGSTSTKRCLTASRCYSLFILSLSSCSLILLGTRFSPREKYGFELFLKIVWASWHLVVVVNLVTCHIMWKSMPSFFIEWQNYQSNFETKTQYKRTVTCILLACAFTSIVVPSFACYTYFKTTFLDSQLTPYKPTEHTVGQAADKLIRVFFVFLYLLGVLVWTWFLGFYAATCELDFKLFSQYYGLSSIANDLLRNQKAKQGLWPPILIFGSSQVWSSEMNFLKFTNKWRQLLQIGTNALWRETKKLEFTGEGTSLSAGKLHCANGKRNQVVELTLLQHSQLSFFKMVEILDNCICVQVMAGMLGSMVNVCFVLYFAVLDHHKFSGDVVLVIFTIFWLVGSIFHVMLLSIIGALINSEVSLFSGQSMVQ